MINQIIAAVCCLTLLFNCGAFAKISMQNLLQEYLVEKGTPGAAVCVIEKDKVQFFCSGKMALDGKPVTEETLFEIGSITKVFTTLALMDMASKGEVQLDDPIEKYLPGVKVPELNGKKITLRHLATHTSGLPHMPDNFAPKDSSNPYQDYTVESLYSFLQSCTLTTVPGESLEYSNMGMGLLGHILCLRSGKSYEELIQGLIAKQLDMPSTCMSITDANAKHFASGHDLRQAVSHWDIPTPFAGAGALRSNIKDMAHFLAANMGKTQTALNTLLQKCHEKQFAIQPEFSVGLGWVRSLTENGDLVWHNGGAGGFRSYMGFNPKTQRGIVILSNSTEDWPDELGLRVLRNNFIEVID